MTRSTESWSAAPFVPRSKSLAALAAGARTCRGCPLWKVGTQTVFGEGPSRARLLFVGEQPGDQEDLLGRPFVGPAGRLLDQALAQAGIDRREIYVTNAVKHFKWVPAGKRRLHKKPSAREVAACRPWLEAEIAAINPAVVIALGATAAQSLIGSAFRITRDRGKVFPRPDATWVMVATPHPSSILRGKPEERAAGLAGLVADLKAAARAIPK